MSQHSPSNDQLRATIYAELRKHYGAINEVAQEAGGLTREHVSRMLRGKVAVKSHVMNAAVSVLNKKRQNESKWVQSAKDLVLSQVAA